MKTQEFIELYLSDKTDKTECSSVFGDNGVVYSYGYHYPLATIIDGKAWINSRSYSNSTSKHQAWARSACADIVGWENVYNVELRRGDNFRYDIIQARIRENLADVCHTMDKKRRKDTQVFKQLMHDYSQLLDTLILLNSRVGA